MSSATRIAISGATGFIGLNLVAELTRRGHDVRCLVRPGSNTAHLGRWSAPCEHLDLNDEAAVTRALAGCRALLHAANDPLDPASISIRTVCRAAAAAGLEHLVFFSTVAVHDIHAGDHAIGVDAPARSASAYSGYKLEAERIVRESCAGSATAFTILRPTNVYGPWDLKGVLFRWFEAAGKHDLTLVGPGRNRIHLCHVHNLVELTAGVVANPAAYGKVYFAADARAETLRDILEAVCRTAGRDLHLLRLPPASVRLVKKVTGRVQHGWRPIRLPPKLAAHLSHDYQVDTRAAGRDLGFAPVHDLESGVRQTAAWYRSFGVL